MRGVKRDVNQLPNIMAFLAPSEIHLPRRSDTNILAGASSIASIQALAATAELAMRSERQYAELGEALVQCLPEPSKTRALRLLERDNEYRAFGRQQFQILQKLVVADASLTAPCHACDLLLLALHLGEWLNRTTTPADLVNRSASLYYEDDELALMTRFWDIFVMNRNHAFLVAKPNYIDLELEFQKHVGLSMELYVSLAFAFATKSIGARDLTSNSHTAYIISPSSYLSSTLVSPAEIEPFFSVASQTVQDYAALTKGQITKRSEPTEELLWGFQELRQRPLLRSNTGVVVVANQRYLLERATSGIYHCLTESMPASLAGSFRRMFGHMYEFYIRRLLERVVAMPRTTFQVEFEKPYGSPEKLTNDALIASGTDLFVLEVLSTRLTDDAKADGNVDVMLEVLLRKAVQIHNRLQDFEAGEYDLFGRGFADYDRIFPVLVTLEHLPQVFLGGPGNATLMSRLEASISAGRHLDQAGVQPIQIVSAEDLEQLEGLSARHADVLPTVLAKRAPDIKLRHGPLRNVLLGTFAGETVRTDHQRVVATHLKERVARTLLDPSQLPDDFSIL